MNYPRTFACFIVALLVAYSTASAGGHLWWDVKDVPNATCLYGQITVLATHENIYFCGANWHPGEPAGGYCGIQNNGGSERRTIFSIWDTSPTLHPTAIAADSRTHVNRFGGEGTGGHTHMLWPWKIRHTFQFFVRKSPGTQPDTTDTRYYIFDDANKTWIHSATITNPNGGHASVATIGGGLNSFLENFSGKDREAPKLATYRLWLGSTIDTMKPLTRASGDGQWGQLHDAFFLAEGDDTRLGDVFATLQDDYGQATFGGKEKKLEPISEVLVPGEVLKALSQVVGR